jgi:hypothetical protein
MEASIFCGVSQVVAKENHPLFTNPRYLMKSDNRRIEKGK